jgi:sporulation protein YlmC with PRC-barrel domain
VYLGRSGLELARRADDVRGLTVVDPNGHRLGDVDDVVIDAHERRVRLLSVVSGGILGLGRSERLIPVETVTKVDDRVHVDRDHVDVHTLRSRTGGGPGLRREQHEAQPPGPPSFREVYDRFGVTPFWAEGRAAVYFDQR